MPTLYATSPFGVTPPALAPPHCDLIVSDRHGLGLANVLAPRAQVPALARRIREHLGLWLPSGPYRAAAGEIAFAAVGPGAFLVTHEGGGKILASALQPAIQGLAAMMDQTGAYGVLRLSGSTVRDLLCRLVPLDLHPRAFQIGDVATTACGHVSATFWRLEDSSAGVPVFEVAVYRSLAGYFWRLLSRSAASLS